MGLASLFVLYAGSGAVAGTRPDNARDAAAVVNFFGHSSLAFFFIQAVFSMFGITFFALAFRRYLYAFAPSTLAAHIIDFGTALVLIEMPVLFVAFGIELALVRLSAIGDPSVFGIFLTWDWIDNGTMLWLEAGWMGALSLAGWLTGGLPRRLAGLGLVVAMLLTVLAVPALPLGYPLGVSLGAYGLWIVWMLLTGLFLVRSPRSSVPRARRSIDSTAASA